MKFESNPSEDGRLEAIWNDLSSIDQSVESVDPQQPEKFGSKLEAYQDGYQDGVNDTRKKQSAIPFPTVALSHVSYAAVAAVVFFMLGFFINGTQRTNEHLRSEMDALKEMMVVNQLKQGSISERVRGLENASSWFASDNRDIEILFRTLRTDPSDTVKLAALDSLAPKLSAKSIRTSFISLFDEETSPLILFEMLRLMIVHGSLEEYQPLADKMIEQGYNAALIERMLQSHKQRI
jgi:hypothetical protein